MELKALTPIHSKDPATSATDSSMLDVDRIGLGRIM